MRVEDRLQLCRDVGLQHPAQRHSARSRRTEDERPLARRDTLTRLGAVLIEGERPGLRVDAQQVGTRRRRPIRALTAGLGDDDVGRVPPR